MKRMYNWLPDRVDGRIRVLAWVYLAAQVLLVGTGGLVRLTDSGLGCPTWPECTDGSLVNTPAMGIHGYIEFGNRALGLLLGILALVVFISVLRIRKERRDLFWLTLVAGLGFPAQAVFGGLSVLSKLNPYVVGLHFIFSVFLVVICTVIVYRAYVEATTRSAQTATWFSVVAWVTAFFVLVTIVLGILTTGSGPHAGDAHSARNGLNPGTLQHLHSLPAYTVFVLTLVMALAPRRTWSTGTEARTVRRFVFGLLIVEFVQIAIGLIQANTGLPGVLVGIHQMLAVILASAMVGVIAHLKAPRRDLVAELAEARSESAVRN